MTSLKAEDIYSSLTLKEANGDVRQIERSCVRQRLKWMGINRQKRRSPRFQRIAGATDGRNDSELGSLPAVWMRDVVLLDSMCSFHLQFNHVARSGPDGLPAKRIAFQRTHDVWYQHEDDLVIDVFVILRAE